MNTNRVISILRLLKSQLFKIDFDGFLYRLEWMKTWYLLLGGVVLGCVAVIEKFPFERSPLKGLNPDGDPCLVNVRVTRGKIWCQDTRWSFDLVCPTEGKCHFPRIQYTATPSSISLSSPTMAPPRSLSQSKISDTFRSSVNATKPLKETKTAIAKSIANPSRTAAAPTVAAPTVDSSKRLLPNDSRLVSAARVIERNRQSPFGTSLIALLMLVHPQIQSAIHTILRHFDLTPRYGPSVGISRLDRYRRAKKMGLKPPTEVLQILDTEEGVRKWNIDLFSQKSAF
jgi:DNA polymerase delta subunit 4